MKELMELLARFVGAVEALAQASIARNNLQANWSKDYARFVDNAEAKNGNPSPLSEAPDATAAAPENMEFQPAAGGTGAETTAGASTAPVVDRKAVRAELDVLKVDYNNKCSTETLAKLLAEEKAKGAAAGPVDDDVFGDPEDTGGGSEDDFLDDEVPPAKTYTLEEVRAALIAYKEANGADKARAILQSVGKAAKLGKVDKANYTALVDACKAE